MAAALRAVQRSDGFWNVNLADPQHLPGPETSGTAFFTYGLAYGIRAGLLDRTTYLPVVARAWNGMVATAVHSDGFLGWVQGVGYEPESSQPVTAGSTADFGVGGFLLAGTEVAGLAG
jgi:rhamnogalacturonyl hydrolase YesR